MAHDKETLAAFQDGETRLVFARRRADPTVDLYEIVDGTANEIRAWVKAELRCPVRDCPTPELTTVNRGKRTRDGFRHLTRTADHAPESLFHLEGKAQIAKWVRARRPDLTVTEELEINPERERVADVLLANKYGGRIAIEIQYAALTPEDWKKRHQSYVDNGVIDVWLFGHHGKQLRRAGAAYPESTIILSPTHEAVAAAGLPLLWFNPLTLQVATVTNVTYHHGEKVDVPAVARHGVLEVAPLNTYRLSGRRGLTSDRLEQLRAGAEHLRRLAEEEAQEKARVEAEQAAWRAAVAAREETIQRDRAALIAGWLESADYAALLTLLGDAPPPCTTADDRPWRIPARVWQTWALAFAIHPLPPGTQVDGAAIAAQVNARFPDPRSQVNANDVSRWFDQLDTVGMLERRKWAERGYGTRYGWFTVEAATANRPAREVTSPAAGADRADEEEAGALGYRRALASQVEDANRGAAGSWGTARARFPRCVVCREKLDPVYGEQGYHPLCASHVPSGRPRPACLETPPALF